MEQAIKGYILNYSASADNKIQVNSSLQGRDLSASLSQLAEIDEPAHIKLPGSARLKNGKGHSHVCEINADHSVFTVSHII